MLKKLRLRFVGINMTIVLVILCTIFCVLLHTTHANLEQESVDMITAVAADPLQLNWPDTASRSSLLYGAHIALRQRARERDELL